MNLLRFLILFGIFIGLNIYLFIRGWQAMPDRKSAHILYSVVFILCATSIFFAVFAGRFLPVWLGFIFEQAGGYWMILFIYLLAGALLGDVLRIADHLFHIFPQWVAIHRPTARFLYFLFVIAVMVVIYGIGFYRFSHPNITEIQIRPDRKTMLTSSYKIVMASDLHLGNIIRKRRLEKWVEMINGQHPDIVLLAGDIFDHNFKAVASQHMDGVFRKLKARYAVIAIPGNHDYYTGVDTALAYLKSAGITVLRDSVAVINREIALIGRDDLTNRNRKPLDSLMIGLDPALFRMVADHQPRSLKESQDLHADLHVSGHTHNGQLFPYNLIVSRVYELGYGYAKKGSTAFYVSSGIGLWAAPIRFGTSSEIVVFRVGP